MYVVRVLCLSDKWSTCKHADACSCRSLAHKLIPYNLLRALLRLPKQHGDCAARLQIIVDGQVVDNVCGEVMGRLIYYTNIIIKI